MSDERRSAMPAERNAGPKPRTTQQPENIDIMDMLFLLLGNAWKIILCAIVGGAMLFSYTYFRTVPTYQATAKMYLASVSDNSLLKLADLQMGMTLKADYQYLLKSRVFLEDVIAALNLPMTPGGISGMISIANPQDTHVLTITATSTDPQQAADIANEVANQAKIFLPKVMKMEDPSLFENAIVPTKSNGNNFFRRTIAGAAMGAVLCSGVIILLHLLNDTLATPDDVRNYLGVAPLAVIVEGDLGEFSQKKHTKLGGKNK